MLLATEARRSINTVDDDERWEILDRIPVKPMVRIS